MGYFKNTPCTLFIGGKIALFYGLQKLPLRTVIAAQDRLLPENAWQALAAHDGPRGR